ncbi:MAG: hypothetical protein CL816_06210 [Coxiellaceae bacterium]|nr:hypothetical protein [Coxiellaceae bacterium]|tara:strand:+ start:1059 stop:1388 length:330 start_codon:yes stop_codon:yes gene_type:complete
MKCFFSGTSSEDVPETLAVEMEGASVAHVCHEHNIPFVIIRTNSDRADSKAAIDFPRFVSTVANIYSKNIIDGIFTQRKSTHQEDERSCFALYPIYHAKLSIFPCSCML